MAISVLDCNSQRMDGGGHMEQTGRIFDSTHLSSFDLDTVLEGILAFIRDHCHVQRAAVLLLPAPTGELSMRKSVGWPADVAAMRISVGEGIIGQAARLNHEVCVPDVNQHDGYVPLTLDTRSELAIPLIACDKPVGVLDLQSDQENFFDGECIALLRACSSHVCLALRHAWMHEREKRLAGQLESISAISRQTTAVSDSNELLARFSALVLQSFPVDHVALLMVEDGRMVLRSHCGKLWLKIPEGQEIPANTGLYGRALVTQNPVLSRNVDLEQDYVGWFADVKSELCLPLISFGESLGVLALYSTKEDGFETIELGALESVADICGAAIQNAIHFEKVRHLAYRDGLTGVFNRRYFEMRVVQELERASRYGSRMSLMMIDLDEFKGLNDQFGHEMGDTVLQQVCGVFVQQLRKTDVICRFGGDEFAVLLPETTAENSHGKAQKLRAAIAGLQLPGLARAISISIGLACCPDDGRTRDDLLKAADDALYRAKEGGRNRVEIAQRTTSPE
jgi:diguanylate cyclase (GGDEF)-like protein